MTDIETTTNAPFLPTAIKNGLIIGVIIIILSLILQLTGMNTSFVMLMVFFLIILILYAVASFRAIKEHRDVDLGGGITFGRAFITGLVAVIAAGLIGTVFSMIYNLYIDPAGVQDTIDATLDFMEQMGASEDDIDLAEAKAARSATDPIYMLTQGMLQATGIGVVASLIIAAILKRDKPIS